MHRETTQTVTVSAAVPVTDFDRRGLKTPIPTPPGLSHFLAAQISSACSCLSIPVPVVTNTITAPPEVSLLGSLPLNDFFDCRL